MSTVEEFKKTADIIAGNDASSLRSPEAQASYFIDKAQIEATIANTKALTKALQELTKAVDTMAMGLIGELMSLKETLNICLTPNKTEIKQSLKKGQSAKSDNS